MKLESLSDMLVDLPKDTCEEAADRRLTHLAKGLINIQAAQA